MDEQTLRQIDQELSSHMPDPVAVATRIWHMEFGEFEQFFTDEQIVNAFMYETRHWYEEPKNTLFGWAEEVKCELLRCLNSTNSVTIDKYQRYAIAASDEPHEIAYCKHKFITEWLQSDDHQKITEISGMMTLLMQVKNRLLEAMKSQDATAKNAIRALLSKLQTSGKETDEDVISAVKMLIKQNDEEIETRQGRVKMPDGSIKEVQVTDQEAEIQKLQNEIVVLKDFLPNFLSSDQIRTILRLSENNLQLNAAKNVGAAIGLAMKVLKSHGAVEGNTVKEVVTETYQK